MNLSNQHSSLGHFISDKVEIDIDVFGSLMKNLILNEVNGRLVVIKDGQYFLSKPNFIQNPTKPL